MLNFGAHCVSFIFWEFSVSSEKILRHREAEAIFFKSYLFSLIEGNNYQLINIEVTQLSQTDNNVHFEILGKSTHSALQEFAH